MVALTTVSSASPCFCFISTQPSSDPRNSRCSASPVIPSRHNVSKSRSSSNTVTREPSAFLGFTCDIAIQREGRATPLCRRLVARRAGRASVVAVAAAAAAGTEELPAKLQEIVRLFQQVADSRAKYQQLLYYAKQLKPLAKEFCTQENKVEGCVSQVWVRPTLNAEDSTVVFEADSDSLLTKGLAALLVDGLSGATVAEVLKVSPDFIQMLGLQQSLTPSRSNGFLNMLKLMQKRTLQMYMVTEAGKSSSAGSARDYGREAETSVAQNSGMGTQVGNGASKNGANFASGGGSEHRSMKLSIEKKLQEALAPTVLVVDDVSHQHAGHAGVHKGATETHFNVKVVSDKFTGNSLIKRHRLIYDLLDDELKNGVHALSLVTKSPSEPA